MTEMFKNAKSFNGNIENWNVSNVTEMTEMFAGASSFNQNLSGWNIARVIAMKDMFADTMLPRNEVEDWGNFDLSELESDNSMPDIWDSD